MSYVCEKKRNILSDELIENWKKTVENEEHYNAHYFYNMIFVSRLTFGLILHEYIHHFAKELRYWTISPLWFFIDDMNDATSHIHDSLVEYFLYGRRH